MLETYIWYQAVGILEVRTIVICVYANTLIYIFINCHVLGNLLHILHFRSSNLPKNHLTPHRYMLNEYIVTILVNHLYAEIRQHSELLLSKVSILGTFSECVKFPAPTFKS